MLKFCIAYFKKYKFHCFVFYSFILLSGGLTLLVPMLNGKIIDFIVNHEQELLVKYIFLFFIISSLIIIFNFIRNRIYIILQTNTAYDIISRLIIHIQNLPLHIIETFDIGYLNQKINNDSNLLTTFTINLIGNFTSNIITLFLSIYILMNINHIIGLTILAIGCVYIFIYVLLKHYIYSISFKLKEEQASFFSAMLNQLQDVKFIKLHSLINEYHERMNFSYQNYYRNVIKSQNFFFLYSSLDSIITITANVLVFIIGSNLVMNSKLSIGDFTIIFSYFNYIINTFKYFSNLGKEFQDNKVSYSRILEIFNLKEEHEGTMVFSSITELSCKNLTFKRNKHILFSNFTFSFKPGKIYCICGENGKGKTTFVETIIGLHKNSYTGQITYNNVDIQQLNTYYLRHKNISVMEQHIHLFDGNANDNILLTSHYSYETLNYIVDDNNKSVATFINSLNKINNFGDGISGGERQKLGICRLFSKNSDIFILDEPTASLDKKNTQLLIQYMNKIKQNKIIILISHDTELIGSCDSIIYL